MRTGCGCGIGNTREVRPGYCPFQCDQDGQLLSRSYSPGHGSTLPLLLGALLGTGTW